MITAFHRAATIAKRMPSADKSPSMATGLPFNGSLHSQKLKAYPGNGSIVNSRDFHSVSAISCTLAAAASSRPRNHVIAASRTASSCVTSIITSEVDGICPSTNSRLPSGARNDAPRLDSSFQPLPGVKPSAEKKPANRSYSAAVPAGRKKEMPLII